MSEVKCVDCGKGPSMGVTVYRDNPLGELPAVWRCAEHRQEPVDAGVQEIVNIIEGSSKD